MDQPLATSRSSASSRPPPGMLANLVLKEGDDERLSVSSLDQFFAKETASAWSFIFAEMDVAVVSSYTVDEVASSLPPPAFAPHEIAPLVEPEVLASWVTPEVLASLGAESGSGSPVSVRSEDATFTVVEPSEPAAPADASDEIEHDGLSTIPSTDADARFAEGDAGDPGDTTSTANHHVWYGVWGFTVTLGLATTVYAALFMR
jgi:hypothetical protein